MNKVIAEERSIPKPRAGGLDPQSITDAFAYRMTYSIARDQYNATDLDAFQALAFAVRDRLMDRWFATQNAYYRSDAKRVYYLSLEFLLGRLLLSNVINLGARKEYVEAMSRLGFALDELAERENDAGLGNGGLGRLAACFLDSASSLALPFYGYGIRYEYGIFRQRIVGGQQTEGPDNWLRYGNPWEVPRPDILLPVRFYGRVEFYNDENGVGRYRWVDTEEIYAMAYDLAVPGYRNNTVNSLRLWAAKSSREFDLERFNAGEYVEAVEDKNVTENISKVLYPSDAQYAGRELRLKQQYFFVSATIQDVIRRFKKKERPWEELPDRVAIQLNDTHPAIAIPEMMRVLVDQEGVEWDRAWWVCERVFGYTNHTVLPEALESWPKDLISRLLPRHEQIIEEIDRRFRESVAEAYPNDEARVRRMAIISDSANVRMAHLAIVGSHSVNGVARLHTEILKANVFAEFHQFFPRKFLNMTNGVTPRRWLLQCNPELSELITEVCGDEWPRDLGRTQALEQYVSDAAFQERWEAIKRDRKERVANWIRHKQALDVEVDSIFDVQIKRIHEYKRQLLNVMHAVALYHRVLDGKAVAPRTIIFAGKAAPSYAVAKLIIRLIHDVASFIRRNPRVAACLQVVFVPNYEVSCAELLFPATELSEQISTAGCEASGTGCMKAIINGGIIMGTLDGANIEILTDVHADNIFTFGNSADEIAALRASGYSPRTFIDADPELKRVIETIGKLNHGTYAPIVDILTRSDSYFHCADFRSYLETQERAAEAWRSRAEWNRMSITNVARSGYFSSDRTIAEYARDIWNVEPVPVQFPRDES